MLSPIEKTALAFKPNMMWLLEQQRGNPLPEVDSEILVDSLESLFAVIGIVEKFNESLAMYEQVFGLPYVEAAQHTSREQAAQQMHVHVGEDISTRKQVQEGLVRQFKENPALDEHIKWDLQLYAKALEIFTKQEKVLWKMRPDLAKIYNPVLKSAKQTSATSPGLQDWFGWIKQGVAISIGTTAAQRAPATTSHSPKVTVHAAPAPPSTSTEVDVEIEGAKMPEHWGGSTGEGSQGTGSTKDERTKDNIDLSHISAEEGTVRFAKNAAYTAREKAGVGHSNYADGIVHPASATEHDVPPLQSQLVKIPEPLLEYDEEVKMAAEMEEISLMRHMSQNPSL